MAFVLTGHGVAAPQRRPIQPDDLAVFGRGASLTLEAAARQPGDSVRCADRVRR
jgi:hypothetical protein